MSLVLRAKDLQGRAESMVKDGATLGAASTGALVGFALTKRANGSPGVAGAVMALGGLAMWNGNKYLAPAGVGAALGGLWGLIEGNKL